MVQSLLFLRIQKKQSHFQNTLSTGKEYQPKLQGGKCLETQEVHSPHISDRSDPSGKDQLPGNGPKNFFLSLLLFGLILTLPPASLFLGLFGL